MMCGTAGVCQTPTSAASKRSRRTSAASTLARLRPGPMREAAVDRPRVRGAQGLRRRKGLLPPVRGRAGAQLPADLPRGDQLSDLRDGPRLSHAAVGLLRPRTPVIPTPATPSTSARRSRDGRGRQALDGLRRLRRHLGQHLPGHQHRQRHAGARLGGHPPPHPRGAVARRLDARAGARAPPGRRPARGARLRRRAVRPQPAAPLLGREDGPVGPLRRRLRDHPAHERAHDARAGARAPHVGEGAGRRGGVRGRRGAVLVDAAAPTPRPSVSRRSSSARRPPAWGRSCSSEGRARIPSARTRSDARSGPRSRRRSASRSGSLTRSPRRSAPPGRSST